MFTTEDETEIEFLSNFTFGDLVFFIIVCSRDKWVGCRIGIGSNSMFCNCWSLWEGADHIMSRHDSHSWRDRSIVVHRAFFILSEDIFNLGAGFFRFFNLSSSKIHRENDTVFIMIMRVFGGIEFIITSFNFITLEFILVSIVVVIRSKFIRIPFNLESLCLSRFKCLSLAEGDKFDDRFFNSAISIWSFDIDFNDIFTSNITSVSDIDGGSITLNITI